MTADEINTLLAETAAALAADEVAPLSDSELQVHQRTLAPLTELLEQRWRHVKPGGPEFLREHAAGRGAALNDRAEAIRLQREQVRAQLDVLSHRRRAARKREALQGLPGAYADAALAVSALETAWSAFDTAVAALDDAAQRVVSRRMQAGDACPSSAPTEAAELPGRIAEVWIQLAARAHGYQRRPGGLADSLGVDGPAGRSHLGLYENVA